MAPAFLHGLETEYAFSQFAEGGGVLDRADGLRTLFAVARKRLECLPDAASSGFSWATAAGSTSTPAITRN